MRFIDFFAGVGGFRLGLERAGMECVGACELDPHARAVYERRFGRPPWFPRDIQEVRSGTIPEAEVWCAGSPCQGFSSAGKRGGLDDPRSGLLATWLRLAADRSPRWLLLENVPTILRINGGGDWGRILAILADQRRHAGWRVLDARGFGVPQRRFRLFLLARGPGDGPDPAEVLALASGGGGYSPASAAAGANDPRDPAGGAGDRGFVGTLTAGASRGGDGSDEAAAGHLIPLASREQRARGQRGDLDYSVKGSVQGGRWHARESTASGALTGKCGLVTGNEAGTLFGTYAIQPEYGQGADLRVDAVDEAPSLTVTENAKKTDRGVRVCEDASVRRLTPLECERLMAMPDGHTCLCGCEPLLSPDYSTAACQCDDAPRYRAIGNAVVSTIPEWIGRRLMAADGDLS